MYNDLISRKAVLSLPRNTTRNFFGEIVEESIDVADIEALPSVQSEIIRCKDCKYFDPLNENVDYNFCDAWAGGTNEDMFCGFAERRQDASSR